MSLEPAPRFNSLPPYQPIEPFEVLSQRLGRPVNDILKCDANENPYGPSPRALQALAALAYTHIYPDPESRQLRAALAGFTGAPLENLLAGSGADELIDLILRVMLEPGDGVLICPPTFGMYTFDTQLNAGRVISVPRRPDFSLDLPALQQAVQEQHPKVLFLANPNNPDGRLLSQEEIEAVLDLPLLVVMDEAYIEFSEQGGRLGEEVSLVRQAAERQNLIVLRTFSKWAGLAGLRVGYGVFPDWLMKILWKAKQPYNVNVAASSAAIASLDDLDWLAANVARIRAERQRLFKRLLTIPYLEPIPSQANFILCRVRKRSAAELHAQLVQQGVFVRYYDTPLLKDFIRVTVGRPEDTERLTAALLSLIEKASERQHITQLWEVESLPQTTPSVIPSERSAVLQRQTNETSVQVTLRLDGVGRYAIQTGLNFFDHMLAQLALHGLFDMEIYARGDLQIDPHHTVEDVALTLGSAFAQALGERRGISRCGWAVFPMDEAMAQVAVDFSGRPYTVFKASWHGAETGGIPNSLWRHFCESFALRAACNLHVEIPYGNDDHHQVEALFKALGRALEAAVRRDPRRGDRVASSKGTVSV